MDIKFEQVSRLTEQIKLPERATKNSAGYDFFAYEDVLVPAKALTRITTGVKCKLRPYMVLFLANRSSNPSKKNLYLSNGVGIVDADYYNNLDNEGEIAFEFYNNSDQDILIKKNEKIGQGVIMTYLKTVDDTSDAVRKGGFGSTSDK